MRQLLPPATFKHSAHPRRPEWHSDDGLAAEVSCTSQVFICATTEFWALALFVLLLPCSAFTVVRKTKEGEETVDVLLAASAEH